ncbi:cyclase family protein [Spongiactinospora sp. TRM90649]|uniref:cyclase family protein n=1 Tax=Spongiactinospora sp. TRM90649 TaxID=3031114 RepID=UPI0023FA0D4C|nr:cyclase family protein [Spongiactinospora sp. TRM90649]MDF5752439.1 cyclase family protein [Spongiactinospora sp. TRM90649]
MCSPETIMAALEGEPGRHTCPQEPPAAPMGRRQAVRAALAAVAGGLGVAAFPAGRAEAAAVAPPPHASRVLDLTHPLSPDFPVFQLYVRRPERRQVMFERVAGFNTAEWTFNEHTGTHMDVPAHSRAGLRTADLIPPQDLVVPLCVVRIAERAARDNITELTVKDIKDWERRHGPLPERAFVASDSGWYKRVADPRAYLQFDPRAQVMRFPGVSPEAAEFLIERRSIVGFGTDTSSLDVGTRREPLVHRMLLTTGRYGLENLAALDTVPERGATLVVGAAKLRGGFGAPVRALALL